MSDDDREEGKDYDIPKMNELRMEIGNNKISIVLLSGTAEIFGNELIVGVEYDTFNMTSIAVFTFLGCCVKIIGTLNDPPYIPEDFVPKSIIKTINLHAALSRIPTAKLMIIGPPSCGKMTLSRFLLNYATRETTNPRKPIFVDLNVELNSIGSLPGCIGCGQITKPCWDFSRELNDVCMLHFGHSSIKKNPDFFKSQCQSLEELLTEKYKNKEGMIITTPSKISIGESQYYDCILALTKIFKIDCLLVMEDQGLFQKLKNDRNVDVLITMSFFGKFCGTIEKQNKKLIQEYSIKKYFSDCSRTQRPFYSRLHELEICRIVSSEIANSCLPIGKERIGKDMFHQEVLHDVDLRSHIGSIIYNDDQKEENCKQPVLAFAYVLESSPASVSICTIGELPFTSSCKLLLSDFKFI